MFIRLNKRVLLLVAAFTAVVLADVKWSAPSINDSLTRAVCGDNTCDGIGSWCNEPHVRRSEYIRPGREFELQYVELIHRHHKRTPYASNGFPAEPYSWDCDDAPISQFIRPIGGLEPASVYRQGCVSHVNPFLLPGWNGSCAFPQITSQGLEDSWQHGVDLYGVYHDVLGLLPASGADFRSAVRFRVTNNPITHQVAAMVINGMWRITDPFPLIVQPPGIDSLEPQYSCPAASEQFDAIKSGSNLRWRQHLDSSAALFRALAEVSLVPPDDAGFHASFDHYFDNLSARQCHGKPLPCRVVDGNSQSPTCITQELANAVYRMGNWEYRHIYRDHQSSLLASAASFGVWIGELTTHLRDFIAGSTDVIYFHNVAHDGSLSRLLSVLQLDNMAWPGMGAEVVFELYKRKSGPQPRPVAADDALSGRRHDCMNTRQALLDPAISCSLPRPALPSAWSSMCHGAQAVTSALPCRVTPIAVTQTATDAPSQTVPPGKSEFYLRVLFGGQPLRSSNPAFGVMDMVPVETVLEYLDSLVGTRAGMVRKLCQS